jgi:hypothetical protein
MLESRLSRLLREWVLTGRFPREELHARRSLLIAFAVAALVTVTCVLIGDNAI